MAWRFVRPKDAMAIRIVLVDEGNQSLLHAIEFVFLLINSHFLLPDEVIGYTVIGYRIPQSHFEGEFRTLTGAKYLISTNTAVTGFAKR